ncbi:ribbon-helix-helix domain-containing protein [Acetobacteraceae bacterium ESL0709]|nr:ribbon-helix-helix domain-containing protein [Acetobacteraceae bacterium ESL0697]MDF7678753.1 ribbon-helix-helix domain-containing protein [Acetobacteraceae bacterium ESL0709]
MSGLIKRSITICRHRTSIALEKEFWDILEEMAQREQLSLAALIIMIDSRRAPDTGLASSLRVAVLKDILTRLAPSEQNKKTNYLQ